jgi:(S)-mandelate dehydrogenase
LDTLVAGKRQLNVRHGFARQIWMSAPVALEKLLRPEWLRSVWFGMHRP